MVMRRQRAVSGAARSRCHCPVADLRSRVTVRRSQVTGVSGRGSPDGPEVRSVRHYPAHPVSTRSLSRSRLVIHSQSPRAMAARQLRETSGETAAPQSNPPPERAVKRGQTESDTAASPTPRHRAGPRRTERRAAWRSTLQLRRNQ